MNMGPLMNVSESYLVELFGHSEKVIQQWNEQGMPRNADGSYTLSKAVRWREKWFKEQQRQKVLLSKLTQRDLIALTGRSRLTIYTWTTKEGLPRAEDGTYPLADFVRWIGGYYQRYWRARYKKLTQSSENLLRVLNEKSL